MTWISWRIFTSSRDGDEIPSPEVIEHASEWISDDIISFQQSAYHGYLNNHTDHGFDQEHTYKFMKGLQWMI